MQLSLREMALILECAWIGDVDLDQEVNICMDSRVYNKGDVFWPLAGERFDAHDFLPQLSACENFMTVLNNEWLLDNNNKIKAYIPVNNTKEALLKLAKGYAENFSMPKIAITGSNGKTSTKDLIHSLLSTKLSGMATSGNYNNDIGVPLSIFRFKKEDQFAVIEMGTNHPGEIEVLSKTLQPDIAIITNIGPSHLEFFGNESAVFTEKLSISAGLKKGGTLIVNADDPYLKKLKTTKSYKVMTFGVNRGQFKPECLEWNDDACASFQIGRTKFSLSVPGIHSLYNAMAAITVASLVKVPKTSIAKSLKAHKGSALRMEIRKISGLTIAADCYNANPASTESALNTIGKMASSGRKIAVLGDMLELGELSAVMHKKIGYCLSELGFDALFTLGDMSKNIQAGARAKGFTNTYHFSNIEDLQIAIQDYTSNGDIILFKASRGMKLDIIANAMSGVEV
jgi:UDP-N-acetylmuramoyl-tripeptide--D-alanyl-D-alanine ligase